MATKRTPTTPPPAPAAPPRPPYLLIEEIRVQGYKSLVDATLHVRPLTLLAGTNSSGKSSIMQPLLLIKQTMEANYNPAGALILNGPHVQAETAGELVSKVSTNKTGGITQLGVVGKEVFGGSLKEGMALLMVAIVVAYVALDPEFKLLSQKSIDTEGKQMVLKNNTASGVQKGQLPEWFLKDEGLKRENVIEEIEVVNGFLQVDVLNEKGNRIVGLRQAQTLKNTLATLMHIPGLRGKPQRIYPATTFKNQIRGTFDLYAAGTISQWQQQNETEKLIKLNKYLQDLGLTNAVTAQVKNANEVELSVNRLPTTSKTKPRKADMVNIADVGIGVSQVLPILVALIAAQEGQLVYVEQPELHLHPRAQVVMAELLAEAARRGVRVIVETHSSLLLLTVQTLVAEGKIRPGDVGLHWFERDAKGETKVTPAEVDENGAYGDWPEDFGEIELKAQDAYLTAVGLRQFGEAAP